MIRKILISLASMGMLLSATADAQLLKGQPLPRGGASDFAKLGTTTCNPRDSLPAELKELDQSSYGAANYQSATEISKDAKYKGLITLAPVNAKLKAQKNFALYAPSFQAVVSKSTKGAIAAIEATYRLALQQLVGAIKFATLAHKSAKAKHEPNDPKAGQYARAFYTGLRRMIDALENLRKFQLKAKTFTGEKLITKINAALATDYSVTLLGTPEMVPADRMGPTGTPLESARKAFYQARHAFERYERAIKEVALAGGERSPSVLTGRNGATVWERCFSRARDGFNGLKNLIKSDLDPEEEEEEADAPPESSEQSN